MFLSLDGAFTKIGIWIVVGIYNVAAAAFKIFLILATGEVVSPSTYNDIIKNFYIVIGIIMLFVLAFSLLKGMVNPDDQKNGTSTIKKIILNLVSSGIIMAVLPTIFAFAYDFQDSVLLTQNTIGRFFNYGSLESTEGGNTIDEIGKGAYSVANGVFSAFLNVNESKCDGSDIAACQESVHAKDGDKISFAEALKIAEDEGRFSQYTDFSENVAKDEVDFNFLLSILAGLLLIYVAVSFCFDMAVRLVKLVFYQIIAPIPLFMRIVPNSKFSDMFSKWTKITLACYAEVYIRIFIFYFTVYLCKAMLSAPFLTTNVFKWGFFIGLLTKAFILMGLVMFMRQAPKLIKDITGLDSGNMKLGIRDKLKEGGAFAAGNALGNLITSKGNPLAAARGFKYGWKNGDLRGVGQEIVRHQQYKDARDAGASRLQIMSDSFLKNTFGIPTAAERASRQIDEEQETATNRTGYDINGNVVMKIAAGSEVSLDKKTMENLEAQKASNTAAISAATDEIRALDKKIAYGETQIKFKSGIKGEAEKKIDEEGSKIKSTVKYTDAYKWTSGIDNDGKRYISDGTHTFSESDFQVGKDITIDGKTYNISNIDANTGFAYYTDANGNKQLIGKDAEFTGTFAQIKEFVNRDLSPELRQQDSLDLNKVRDGMIKTYVAGELSSASDNRVKQLTRAGFNTIINNGGYEYLSYDANGNEQKGKITVTIGDDGKYVVKDILNDVNGNVIRDRVLSDTLDEFGVIDELDKLAKSSNGVLADKKQRIDEIEIDAYRGQNEAIDNLKKQYDELKEAKRKSEEQRAREASKNYIGNRGDKK